ncbi:hypothetical protein RHSIM_RhsimUnG0149300 [Rhododendron simsii]|uniref:Uncharacterized protein n=1 Tax=Rhododendron simsii TaxID=118357 RepID=A0A834FUS1_RHOSS|nr:hypothetical protein RHSIM_RhsimUnG0149300 [Rhododendron simsii]
MPTTTPSASFPTTPPPATAASPPRPYQHTCHSRSQSSRRRRTKICDCIYDFVQPAIQLNPTGINQHSVRLKPDKYFSRAQVTI